MISCICEGVLGISGIMNQNSKPHRSLEKFLVSMVTCKSSWERLSHGCETHWLERLMHVLGFPEAPGLRI